MKRINVNNPLKQYNCEQEEKVKILDNDVYDFWRNEDDDLYDDLLD
ncbi:hypothetical protein [Bacillus thuringiensis]